MRKKFISPIILLIYILILLFFCRGPNEPIPFRSPDLSTPVVNGLIITSEYGPEPIAVWGNPSLPEIEKSSRFYKENKIEKSNNKHVILTVPEKFIIYTPYPNPSNGSFSIRYSIPASSKIKMWIVPAVLAGTETDNSNLFSNGLLISPGGFSVKVLINNEEKSAGDYIMEWSGIDNDDKQLPSGFYRIYIEGYGIVLWQDVLLAWDSCDIPLGIRKLLRTEGSACN